MGVESSHKELEGLGGPGSLQHCRLLWGTECLQPLRAVWTQRPDTPQPSGAFSRLGLLDECNCVQNFLLWAQALPHEEQQGLALLPPGHSEALTDYFSLPLPLPTPT